MVVLASASAAGICSCADSGCHGSSSDNSAGSGSACCNSRTNPMSRETSADSRLSRLSNSKIMKS